MLAVRESRLGMVQRIVSHPGVQVNLQNTVTCSSTIMCCEVLCAPYTAFPESLINLSVLINF